MLNLELSCAISQNFITPPMLPTAWPALGAQYHAFAMVLRDMLAHCRPDLCASLPPVSAASATAERPSTRLPLCWRALVGSTRGATTTSADAGAEGNIAVCGAAPCGAAAATPLSASAAPSTVLFVTVGWVEGWVARRPMAAAVLATATAAELYAYHEQLEQLARVVRERNAFVVLVGRGASMRGTDDTREDQVAPEALVEALAEHGMRVAALVRPGEEAAWAQAAGARSWALLQAMLPLTAPHTNCPRTLRALPLEGALREGVR